MPELKTNIFLKLISLADAKLIGFIGGSLIAIITAGFTVGGFYSEIRTSDNEVKTDRLENKKNFKDVYETISDVRKTQSDNYEKIMNKLNSIENSNVKRDQKVDDLINYGRVEIQYHQQASQKLDEIKSKK